MARSGGFLADDMTTDEPIALPLAFYRISQAISSILPSDSS